MASIASVVCINNNQQLFEVIRLINGQTRSKEQLVKAKELFASFADENRKGENENDK